MQRLKELSTKVIAAKTNLNNAIIDKDKANEYITYYEKQLRFYKAAIHITTKISEALQSKASMKLASIASLMESAIFPDPYEVVIKFNDTAKGTIEAAMMFERNGKAFKPVLPSGQMLAGGAPIETAAFGTRIALWAQQKPRARPIFFMDEPFRFIQKDLLPVVLSIVNEICNEMHLQIIWITHENELKQNKISIT